MYEFPELGEIVVKVGDWLEEKIYRLNQSGEVDQFLHKIGYLSADLDSGFFGSDPKVLVIGDLACKKEDIRITLRREYGLSIDDFDFKDYDEIARLGIGKLEHSTKYSDIFVGPVPHSVKDMGDHTSLVSSLESHPEYYPKVHRLTVGNGELKITKTSFKEAIKKSVYHEIKSENESLV
jgi:hypothetical protein